MDSRDGAGRIDLGGPDAALLGAQPNCARLPCVRRRKGTPRSGIDDGAGGGAEADVFVQLAQAPNTSSSSNGCLRCMAALTELCDFKRQPPTSSSLYSTTTW